MGSDAGLLPSIDEAGRGRNFNYTMLQGDHPKPEPSADVKAKRVAR